MPKRFKRYSSIKKLISSLLEVPESQVEEYGVEFKGGGLSYKDWVKSLKLQKIWGFVSDKGIVHFWMDNKCPMETLIAFIAHETGHINGRQYKDQDKEEQKAHEIEQIAVYAYAQSFNIRRGL